MTLSTHYTEGKHRKSLHFLAFTRINLTRKCMFLAANSGEYIVVHSENAMFPNFGLGNFSLLPTFKKGCPHYVHNFHCYANSLCSKNLTIMLKSSTIMLRIFFPDNSFFYLK